MSIYNFLDYLVKKDYLQTYRFEENGIVLTYGLSSVGSTDLWVDYNIINEDDDLIKFLNTMIIKVSELAEDFYGCLEDENDFYGYSNKEELDDRIDEETDYLNDIIYNVFKKYIKEEV